MAERFDDTKGDKQPVPQLKLGDLDLPPSMKNQGQTKPVINEPGAVNDGATFWGAADVGARGLGSLLTLKNMGRRYNEPFSQINPHFLDNLKTERDAVMHATDPMMRSAVRGTAEFDALALARTRLPSTDSGIANLLKSQSENTALQSVAARRFGGEWNAYQRAANDFRINMEHHNGFMGKAFGSILAAEVGKVVADGIIAPNEKPGGLTAFTDLISPALLATGLQWRYKILGMIAAHVAARLMD